MARPAVARAAGRGGRVGGGRLGEVARRRWRQFLRRRQGLFEARWRRRLGRRRLFGLRRLRFGQRLLWFLAAAAPVVRGSGVPAATGWAGLSSDWRAPMLVGGAPASTVTMMASCGGSVGRNGDAHHSAAAARPCSDSASTSAAGDIWLDFEWRALTVWATTLRYYVPACGRRLAGARCRSQLVRLKWSGRTKAVLGARDVGRERRIGPGLADHVHGGGVERRQCRSTGTARHRPSDRRARSSVAGRPSPARW